MNLNLVAMHVVYVGMELTFHRHGVSFVVCEHNVVKSWSMMFLHLPLCRILHLCLVLASIALMRNWLRLMVKV